MHEIKDSGTTITVHLLVFICVLCFIYSNEIHISIVFCFFFFYFEKVKILGEPMPKFSILKTHRPLTTTLKRPLFRRRPPHPLSNREIIRLQSGRTTNDDRERTNAVRGLPAILTLVSNSAEKYQQRGPPPWPPKIFQTSNFVKIRCNYSRGNFFVSIFFNSNDNDDDSYYRSLNVFVVYLLQYPKHICAFVILFVHLLMMMMMLMMRMMRMMTNMGFVE